MSESTKDLKAELDKTVAHLQALREEARLKVHLAGLEAKERWNKLEPELDKVQDAAKETTEAAKQAATKGLNSIKEFLASVKDSVHKDKDKT
ncbi:MAG TPA: hypothetical protein VGM06_05970 [Polyangiaceae bacterium]|jgi:hypothetical protein